jgi:hypothetical protein
VSKLLHSCIEAYLSEVVEHKKDQRTITPQGWKSQYKWQQSVDALSLDRLKEGEPGGSDRSLEFRRMNKN